MAGLGLMLAWLVVGCTGDAPVTGPSTQAATPPAQAASATAKAAIAPTPGQTSRPVDPGRPPRSLPWERLAGMFQSGSDSASLLKALSEPARPPMSRPLEADLHLQAIVYVDPQSWVVWINGRALRSGHDHGSLKLLSVTPQEVRLTAEHGDPGNALPVIALRPMQSYLTATGRVVDRSAVVSLPPPSLP